MLQVEVDAFDKGTETPQDSNTLPSTPTETPPYGDTLPSSPATARVEER
jgi:hypothetical protein